MPTGQEALVTPADGSRGTSWSESIYRQTARRDRDYAPLPAVPAQADTSRNTAVLVAAASSWQAVVSIWLRPA